MLDLMPVHLEIEKRASNTMARIRSQFTPTWDGIGTNKRRSLISRWDKSSSILKRNIQETDRIPAKFICEKNFKVHPPEKGRIRAKEHKGMAHLSMAKQGMEFIL